MSEQRVSSIVPDTAAAAARGEPTAPAVATRWQPRKPWRPSPPDRVETYKATRPDGSTVTVEHNIDTGETKTVGAV